MKQIIIALNGQTEKDIETGDFFHSISWEALLPTIEIMANLRPWEQIGGLIISDTDIRVKINQKRGRKAKSDDAI